MKKNIYIVAGVAVIVIVAAIVFFGSPLLMPGQRVIITNFELNTNNPYDVYSSASNPLPTIYTNDVFNYTFSLWGGREFTINSISLTQGFSLVSSNTSLPASEPNIGQAISLQLRIKAPSQAFNGPLVITVDTTIH
jgi:hypothetical protein